MPRLHIRATALLKGQTEFVTLGLVLGNGATSDESWEESVLRANPEVMNFLSKAKITLVSEADVAKQREAVAKAAVEAERLDAALDPDLVTVDDALEVDNPSSQEMRRLIATAKQALAGLEAIVAGPVAGRAKRVEAPAAQGKPAEDDKGDGLDLPMNAPPGLRPQQPTELYLKKGAAEKRKFLKECRDIGILRDVALHEPDPKIKMLARKAARSAEKTAEEAINLAQAV